MNRLDSNASIIQLLKAVDMSISQSSRKIKTPISKSESELLPELPNLLKISPTTTRFSNYLKEIMKSLSRLLLLITRNGNLILNFPLNFTTQLLATNILEKTPQLKSLFWMKISLENLVS
jgi:hypothetical protein